MSSENDLINFRSWLRKLNFDFNCPNCGEEGTPGLYCRDCNTFYLASEGEAGVLGFATMFKEKKAIIISRSSLKNKK